MSGTDLAHRHAVGGLFRAHYPWLCARLRQYLGSGCEDIAAEAFVRLLEAPQPAAIREPRALLTTIARRLIYQLWRRRDLEQAYIEALATLGDGLVPSAEEHYAVMQALQQIDATLGGLPPKVRQVFLLSQLEGMTYSDISRTLGLPVISVRRAMARSIAACSASN